MWNALSRFGCRARNTAWLLALCAAASAWAQETPDPRLLPERFPRPGVHHALRDYPQQAFSVGERLVFDISYGPVTAGEGILSIPSIDTVYGRACFRITVTAQSASALRWLYRVDDRFDTFVDMRGLFPWRFVQRLREGGYSNDESCDFDQANHRAYTGDHVYTIPENVVDIVSAFYFVRTMDFASSKLNDVVTFKNFYKDTTYTLGVRYLGKQRVRVAAGMFDCIMVEPMITAGGLFKSEGRIVIWLTNDERKVPVRVRTKILIGSIDAELKQYVGVIEPLRAKVR